MDFDISALCFFFPQALDLLHLRNITEESCPKNLTYLQKFYFGFNCLFLWIPIFFWDGFWLLKFRNYEKYKWRCNCIVKIILYYCVFFERSNMHTSYYKNSFECLNILSPDMLTFPLPPLQCVAILA